MSGNDKNDDKTAQPGPDSGQSSVPEVEAEIVGEEGDLDIDDAAEKSAGPSGDEPSPAPGTKSAMTPGVVLFVAFAALALIILAAWRFTGGNDARETPVPDAAALEDIAADAEDPAVALDETAVEPPRKAELDAAEDGLGDAPASKIENEAPALKEAAMDSAEIDRTAPPGEPFLPPVASEKSIVNEADDFRAAAKESLRSLNENNEKGSLPPQSFTPEDDAGPAPDLPLKIANSEITASLETLKEEFRLKTEALSNALAEERARNAALQQNLEELRIEVETAKINQGDELRSELAQLKEQFAAYQRQHPPQQTDKLSSLLSLRALEQRIVAGKPFAGELSAVRAHYAGFPSIAALEPFAKEGVTTVGRLQDEFPAVARQLLAAASTRRAKGVAGKLTARAQSLVSVRPAQPKEGDGPAAVISRAEAAIEAGAVETALDELSAFSPDELGVVQDWLDLARPVALAQSALAELKSVNERALQN